MASKLQKNKSHSEIQIAVSPLHAPMLRISSSKSLANLLPLFPSPTERKEAKTRSNQIDKVLKSDAARAKKDDADSNKVILLGTGNSGKDYPNLREIYHSKASSSDSRQWIFSKRNGGLQEGNF